MIDKAVDSAVLDGYFSAIADAIRSKGQRGTFSPAQMADAIDDIQTTPRLQTKSATPTESAQVITPDNGYDGLDEVDVGAISSSYVGSGITRRSDSDLTASGATVNVSAGYYASQASKAVASGNAGTPTATKGSVSNHAVTVTPEVTNTEGYIAGGKKTGTGVQVSASELVSGSETKTENGTYDVTNLAEIKVNVSGGSSKNVQVLQSTSRANSASPQRCLVTSLYQKLALTIFTGLVAGRIRQQVTLGEQGFMLTVQATERKTHLGLTTVRATTCQMCR